MVVSISGGRSNAGSLQNGQWLDVATVGGFVQHLSDLEPHGLPLYVDQRLADKAVVVFFFPGLKAEVWRDALALCLDGYWRNVGGELLILADTPRGKMLQEERDWARLLETTAGRMNQTIVSFALKALESQSSPEAMKAWPVKASDLLRGYTPWSDWAPELRDFAIERFRHAAKDDPKIQGLMQTNEPFKDSYLRFFLISQISVYIPSLVACGHVFNLVQLHIPIMNDAQDKEIEQRRMGEEVPEVEVGEIENCSNLRGLVEQIAIQTKCGFILPVSMDKLGQTVRIEGTQLREILHEVASKCGLGSVRLLDRILVFTERPASFEPLPLGSPSTSFWAAQVQDIKWLSAFLENLSDHQIGDLFANKMRLPLTSLSPEQKTAVREMFGGCAQIGKVDITDHAEAKISVDFQFKMHVYAADGSFYECEIARPFIPARSF